MRAVRNVSWEYMESDGKKSLVTALQLVNRNSQVSSKAVAMSLYSLHIRALNSLLKSRQDQKTENRKLVAYYPVTHESTNVDDSFPDFNPFQKHYGGADLLQSHYKSVECALKSCSVLHLMNLQLLRLMDTKILYTIR